MIPPHLRRKRVWTVADFALFAGLSHKSARKLLKRYHDELGGRLLRPSQGTNREYTFLPSLLARYADGLFEPIESLEVRVDDIEDKLGELHRAQRIVAVQTGQNTGDIGRLKRQRAA